MIYCLQLLLSNSLALLHPGLFRGRGEHPKMGRVKKRITAADVIINIGQDAVVPAPPAGQRWKKVVHNNTVTWLCSWHDTINTQAGAYTRPLFSST